MTKRRFYGIIIVSDNEHKKTKNCLFKKQFGFKFIYFKMLFGSLWIQSFPLWKLSTFSISTFKWKCEIERNIFHYFSTQKRSRPYDLLFKIHPFRLFSYLKYLLSIPSRALPWRASSRWETCGVWRKVLCRKHFWSI